MRTDWKISDPSPARRRLTAHLPGVRPRCQNRIGPPLQSPQFVGNVNEDGVGEGCGFSGGGKGDDFDGREHLRPHGWMSIRHAQQIDPLLPQSMPTHLSFFTHSCCLIRDAPRVQSGSRSWTFWIPLLLWSYQHLVIRFSQRCWDARSQDSRPVALHVL